MRVLGIDPGFDRLGLAVIEGNPSKPVLVWSECVMPARGAAQDRLSAVTAAVAKAIKKYAPDAVGLERLFFSTNRKTAIKVGEARGAVLSAVGESGLPVFEFTPQQVKLAVTGYGASDKTAIARMVPRLIALPLKKRLDDEFDALAIAIATLSSTLPS